MGNVVFEKTQKTKSFYDKYNKDFSETLFETCEYSCKEFSHMLKRNVIIHILDEENDAVGYTTKPSSTYSANIYVNPAKIPDFEKNTVNQNILITRGVLAHESLHQRFTDFEAPKKYVNDSKLVHPLLKDIFFQLFNIVEDARIEHYGFLCLSKTNEAALNASIRHFHKTSPSIEEIKFEDKNTRCFYQLMNALVMYGDLGYVKGNFTDKESLDAFKRIVPIYFSAILEKDGTNIGSKVYEIFKIVKEFLPSDKDLDKTIENLKKQLSEMLKSMGKDSSSVSSGENSGRGESFDAASGGRMSEGSANQSSSNAQSKEREEKQSKLNKDIKESAEKEKQKQNENADKNSQSGGGTFATNGGKNDGENAEDNKKDGMTGSDHSSRQDSGKTAKEDSENRKNAQKDAEKAEKQRAENAKNNKQNKENENDNDVDISQGYNKQKELEDSKKNSKQNGDDDNGENKNKKEADIDKDEERNGRNIVKEAKDSNRLGSNYTESTDNSPVNITPENYDTNNGRRMLFGSTETAKINRNTVEKFTNRIRNIWTGNVSKREYNNETGKLNIGGYAQLKNGVRPTGNDGVFEKRTYNPNNRNAYICVAMDCSGSTGHANRDTRIAEVGAMIKYSMNKLNVPCDVFSYTTYGQYPIHINLAAAEDKSDKAIYAICNNNARSGNNDSAAIREAGRRAKERGEFNKIVIVISDGYPTEGGGYSKKAGRRISPVEATEEAYKDLINSKINYIVVSVGDDMEGNNKYFSQNKMISVPDSTNKFDAIFNQLADTLKEYLTKGIDGYAKQPKLRGRNER